MKRILKDTIPASNFQTHIVRGKVLSVKEQYGNVVVYYEQDDLGDNPEVMLHLFYTGTCIDSFIGIEFLDTVMLYDGNIVVHVYIQK